MTEGSKRIIYTVTYFLEWLLAIVFLILVNS